LMKKNTFDFFLFFFAALIMGTSSGCSSLIFGNIKPFEEKSQTYTVVDISKDDSSWTKITNSEKKVEREQNRDNLNSDISDVSYFSKDTGATISLNSTCKNYLATEKKPTLTKLTDDLLSGTLRIQSTGHSKSREEKTLILQNIPALQTISKGELNGQIFVIETVVLQSKNCIYDMIYVANADQFKQNEKDFSRFVFSLRLK
jgi:hypothetical protein